MESSQAVQRSSHQDGVQHKDIERSQMSARGMISPAAVTSRSLRNEVSDIEWKTRVDLAACYRLMAVYGMTDMIYNHISARLPDSPDLYLINPYGQHYSEITASSLQKVDKDGEIVLRGNTHYGINHAGFVIHGAIHEARHDVQCVIHTHTRAGIAVSAMACGLLPISLHAMRFSGNVGYHDCEGTVVNLDERSRFVKDLGGNDVLILRNHGLLVCGATIPEAFNAIFTLENACQAQVDAMAARTELVIPSDEIQRETAYLFRRDVRRAYGEMEWEAMLRLLDRQDPTYKL